MEAFIRIANRILGDFNKHMAWAKREGFGETVILRAAHAVAEEIERSAEIYAGVLIAERIAGCKVKAEPKFDPANGH
jgi:hypothetical protein